MHNRVGFGNLGVKPKPFPNLSGFRSLKLNPPQTHLIKFQHLPLGSGRAEKTLKNSNSLPSILSNGHSLVYNDMGSTRLPSPFAKKEKRKQYPIGYDTYVITFNKT
jgi:hypothetical protein